MTLEVIALPEKGVARRSILNFDLICSCISAEVAVYRAFRSVETQVFVTICHMYMWQSE